MFKPKESEEAFVGRLREKYLSDTDVLTEQAATQEFAKYFDNMIEIVEFRYDSSGNVKGARLLQRGGASYRHAATRVFNAIFQPREDEDA